MIAEPRRGAGSHIRVVLDRRWKGKGWLFAPMVALFGRQMFKRSLQMTLTVLPTPVEPAQPSDLYRRLVRDVPMNGRVIGQTVGMHREGHQELDRRAPRCGGQVRRCCHHGSAIHG